MCWMDNEIVDFVRHNFSNIIFSVRDQKCKNVGKVGIFLCPPLVWHVPMWLWVGNKGQLCLKGSYGQALEIWWAESDRNFCGNRVFLMWVESVFREQKGCFHFWGQGMTWFREDWRGIVIIFQTFKQSQED